MPRSRTSRLLILIALLGALALPALPARAAEVHTVHYVPSVDGAVLRVEVWRDPAKDPQPVLLTYSPYNTINDAGFDESYRTFVTKGYARAVADVLGTRGSTGCWDYGGLKEQQSGVDVVKFVAGKKADVDGALASWSNGRVGMIGGSYDGTTATMVAARGDDVPELKAIVPIAAISRWYGYAYRDGVRYFLNSRAPLDEGFDTPLLFDAGFGRTVAPDPDGPYFDESAAARAGECGAVAHTQHGYSRSPDYGSFWLERDYLKDAGKFRAAVLVAHGWQDYNVKQDEGLALFQALPVDDPDTAEVEGVPYKRMWFTQATHSGGTEGMDPLLNAFLARFLKGTDSGIETQEPVTTRGRSVRGPDATVRHEASWPPPATRQLTLHLGRSFDTVPGVPSVGPVGTTGEYGTLRLAPQNDGTGWTHIDDGTVSEEVTLRDPLNRTVKDVNGQPVRGHGYYSLYHESEPLLEDVRIAGSAVLDAWVSSTVNGQHLTPLLVEVDAATGSLSLVQRGFLNLDYRKGLGKAEPRTPGYMNAKVTFLPQDYTFTAGNRIGIILQSSNTVWAVPGAAGTISYANGPVANTTAVGTRLLLPVVGLADPGQLLRD